MSYDVKFAEMIKKLEKSKNVTIDKKIINSPSKSKKKKKDDLDNIDINFEMKFSPLLDEVYDLLGNFHCHWSFEKNKERIPGGEFRFEEFGKAFYLDNQLYSSSSKQDEKKLVSELKPFEDHPIAGDGIVVAFELLKGSSGPQLWLYDNGDIFSLNLELRAYLDTLLLTKGFFNWQYLFLEDFKKNKKYSLIEPRLSLMVEELPRLFPDEDFELLKRKLGR